MSFECLWKDDLRVSLSHVFGEGSSSLGGRGHWRAAPHRVLAPSCRAGAERSGQRELSGQRGKGGGRGEVSTFPLFSGVSFRMSNWLADSNENVSTKIREGIPLHEGYPYAPNVRVWDYAHRRMPLFRRVPINRLCP